MVVDEAAGELWWWVWHFMLRCKDYVCREECGYGQGERYGLGERVASAASSSPYNRRGDGEVSPCPRKLRAITW